MDISVTLNQSRPAVAFQDPASPKASPKPDDVRAIKPVEPPRRAELEQAVSDIREFVQATQRNLDFSIDDSTGVVVVKVIATDSGEVIRQLPTEAALKLAESLSSAGSLLFDDKI